MDKFVVLIYHRYRVVLQSAAHPIATFPFAFLLLPGNQETRLKPPESYYPDGRVHFRRIKVPSICWRTWLVLLGALRG